MRERNLDSWHLLINGYVANGQGNDGLLLFKGMKKSGLRPDEDTFMAVFTACSSAGVVEEGFLFFEVMRNEYSISLGIDHYLGVIDILGKAGHLYEAAKKKKIVHVIKSKRATLQINCHVTIFRQF